MQNYTDFNQNRQRQQVRKQKSLQRYIIKTSQILLKGNFPKTLKKKNSKTFLYPIRNKIIRHKNLQILLYLPIQRIQYNCHNSRVLIPSILEGRNHQQQKKLSKLKRLSIILISKKIEVSVSMRRGSIHRTLNRKIRPMKNL